MPLRRTRASDQKRPLRKRVRLAPREVARAALDDPRREQAPARGRHEVIDDARAPRRFPEDCHVRGIASEGTGVRFHPLERSALVFEPVIARHRMRGILGVELRERKEPERAEAIVHGHDDRARRLREDLPVVFAIAARAEREPAAVKPDEDGKRRARRPLGCPNVERQAVLFRIGRELAA